MSRAHASKRKLCPCNRGRRTTLQKPDMRAVPPQVAMNLYSTKRGSQRHGGNTLRKAEM